MSRNALILAIACTTILSIIGGCASHDSAGSAAAANGERVALSVKSQGQSDNDEIIALDQCPAAVQAAIQAHLNGGTIKEIERTSDHGEVLYEVDVQTADGVIEFDVAEDGAFRGYEADGGDGGKAQDDADDDDEGDDADDEQEQEIPLADVPQNVVNAALAAVPGIVIEEATIETEGDAQVYELEGEVNGQDYEIEISADGKVLEIEAAGGDDDDDGGAADDDDGDGDDDHSG